jgi:hypothetical protein
MNKYLLSIYQPDGAIPAPELLEPVMRNLAVWEGELKTAGAWVFNGALHPAGDASVLQLQAGEVLVTDGPFAEGKEHLGGFTIIQAPDLDAALEWGRKLARATTIAPEGPGLSIEVRQFHGEFGD